MKEFLKGNRPLITVLLSSQTEEGLYEEIEECLLEGTDAFGLQIERLPRELRTREKLTGLFAAMQGKPIYVTCYKRWDIIEESDEERANTLLLALECGADLADVRGDLYDACDGELTNKREAVQKQKELIAYVHAMGKQALMSSHVIYDDAFTFVSAEEVLKIAQAQVERGADVVKIITNADTEEELLENFKIISLLKEKISVPCLFLCNGKNCLRHRLGAGLIYEPMVFARAKRFSVEGSPQLAIESYVKIFECFNNR